MKTIGIKLADGSFYPILKEGEAATKSLDLTTVQDNQTTVHVDVYRSESETMQDAEYIDTLEIKNLKPHENGEPSLNLDITLNENNELSAEITDPETGKKSETQVTLISRTLSEASSPAVEFNNDPTLSEAVSEESMIGPSPNDEDFSFEDVNEELKKDPAEEINAESDIFSSEELDLPDFGESDDTAMEETSIDESELILNVPQEENSETVSDENNTDDGSAVAAAALGAAAVIGTAAAINAAKNADNKDAATEESQDLSSFDSTEISADNTVADDTVTESDEFSLPDFDDTVTDSTADSDTLPDFNDTVTDDTAAESDEFSLPDFDDTVTDSTADSDTLPDFNDTVADDTVTSDTLPDFNDTIADDTVAESDEFSLPDFDDNSTEESIEPVGLGGVFDDDFGEPDLSNTEEAPVTKDPTFQPNDAMFSGLYDKETIEGNSSSYSDTQEEDSSKKTKVPVIICVTCAIICIIAVLLLLFVIPSKFNLLKKSAKTKCAEPAPIEEPLVQDEPLADFEPVEPEQPAIEDTIVVAETPETVVPELPPPPAEKPADIKYKIKWGDTLWDISQAYYKNPWRYKMLAQYNGIRNPDHIISGTWILIPAE